MYLLHNNRDHRQHKKDTVVQSLFTLTEQTNQFINRQFFEFDHDNDSVISQHDFERGAPTVQRFKIIELFKHFDRK